MARPLPPLTWFRSFEASARRLSFTAAADELGLTQSAISQQVRALELRLGTELFHRKARGLALTDDGRKLLPKVASSLDLLSEATASFDAGPTEGLISVATSISVARWIIAPRLSGFLDAHAELRIRILGTIWPDDFRAALADVEIRFGSDSLVGKGAERLLPDALIAVAAPSVSADIATGRLIEAVGVSEGWRDWARAAGIPTPAPSIYVDSHGAALDLAVAGGGIALTSALLARPALAQGRLAQLGDVSLPSSEGYFLAVNADAPDAHAFADWLRGLVAA